MIDAYGRRNSEESTVGLAYLVWAVHEGSSVGLREENSTERDGRVGDLAIIIRTYTNKPCGASSNR